MKHSFVFLAPGFEEIEALGTVDIMRRAGMRVATVAVTADGSDCVSGAHGVTVKADTTIDDAAANLNDSDWLICPGGMPGATNLAENKTLREALVKQAENGAGIAAICAAPAVVLAPLGILDGRKATCYPGFESRCNGARMVDKHVVLDGNLITGQGPAAAEQFALAIVDATLGREAARQVGEGMLYYQKSDNYYF